ncbi:uncharacterized protein V1516DRAFT_656901 [Lipomyces oligophaga]|uniref:uncharacterized protein n=1 Tax=Lipomyces oligophaga TaxID=45792 RepID=UPI0034CFD19A
MVGLSAPRSRQKLSFDPQNTAWSKDTGRFGHKHMEKLGWTPGRGLGTSASGRAITTHIKISVKDDFEGLGAKTAKLAKQQDPNAWAPGLDSFQALLSRLNQNDQTSSTSIAKDYTRIGKWGNRVKFVFGESLGATFKAEELDEVSEVVEIVDENGRNKRKHVEVSSAVNESGFAAKKMKSKTKKVKKADQKDKRNQKEHISKRKHKHKHESDHKCVHKSKKSKTKST